MFMKKKEEKKDLKAVALDNLLSHVQKRMAEGLGKKPMVGKIEVAVANKDVEPMNAKPIVEIESPEEAKAEAINPSMEQLEELPEGHEEFTNEPGEGKGFMLVTADGSEHAIDESIYQELKDLMDQGEEPEVMVAGKKLGVKSLRA